MTKLACLHPIRHKLEAAELMPDYFGHGKDGRKFKDNSGVIFPIDKVQQFNDTPAPVLSPTISAEDAE
jgi:hypothetical protein